MIRHTGGRSSLPGPTSTRSSSASRAMASAWGRGLIPSFDPSSPMRSTSRARMRSLIRASSTAAMLACLSDSGPAGDARRLVHARKLHRAATDPCTGSVVDRIEGRPGRGGPQWRGAPPGAYPGEEELDPEEMREMLARLAATPVELIVAQFAVQLQELGVLHLGIAQERAESLGQAALAIDALGALVEGLGERLAPNDEPLRQVLAQLRLAFVEVANAPAPEE